MKQIALANLLIIDFKLGYWQRELNQLQKSREKVRGKITKAKERIDAFKAAGGHPVLSK